MSKLTREILKTYFQHGDQPTEGQFGSLIDSMANLIDDRYKLGLRQYQPTYNYVVGDTVIYNGLLQECIADTTGTFNPAAWQVLVALGAVVFIGTWNAATNTPALTDGVGTKGHYYVVSVAGSTSLGGITDWQVTDWVIFDGTNWTKVDNSEAGSTAADISFTPNGDITSTNVQNAVVEVRDDTDTKLGLKSDKVSGATSGHFAGLNASGNLTDSGFSSSSFLPSSTAAVNIPYTPGGTVSATDVQNAIDEVASEKTDKVSGATSGHFAGLNTSGNLTDSGFSSSSFLASSTVAANIPYTPGGTISSTNVQGAIDEVGSEKTDKVSGATSGHFAGLNASGNLTDSGFSSSSFLPGSTTASTLSFSPSGSITATNVQAAIVQVNDLATAAVNGVKVVVLPFTFDGAYGTTSASFARIPLQVTIPLASDIYSGAGTILAQLEIDYLTTGSADGEAGLIEWYFGMGTTPPPVGGSTITLPNTSNTWQKVISTPFAIGDQRTYQIVLRRAGGSGSAQVQIEAANLILKF